MKTCASCRFMGASRGVSTYEIGGNGELSDDYHESPHSTCTRVIHGNGGELSAATVMTAPALVVDGSGYAARLIVLPTFGCTLHEDK